jgi:hypothetical protein
VGSQHGSPEVPEASQQLTQCSHCKTIVCMPVMDVVDASQGPHVVQAAAQHMHEAACIHSTWHAWLVMHAAMHAMQDGTGCTNVFQASWHGCYALCNSNPMRISVLASRNGCVMCWCGMNLGLLWCLCCAEQRWLYQRLFLAIATNVCHVARSPTRC